MVMMDMRRPSLRKMEMKKERKRKKERVSVYASKKDNEGAAGVQVVDIGLFSLLGPSRTRCASGSVPPAVLDMS